MLQKLSGRVWWYPHDADPATIRGGVAVIADDAGSTLVDAGNSPAHARLIRAAIADAGLPAPTRVVYTHHHWDHVWGACAWPEAEIIGHRSGVRLLEAEARRPWSADYLRDFAAANPLFATSFRARARAMPTWDDFRIVPPHTAFDTTLDLPGGIEVRHVGGRHAEDSTVVAVPDSAVLLLGDCYYPPPVHLRRPGDTHDHAMLRKLLKPPFSWYVDSHSTPRRKAIR
jgi:glyoxylase-like metal-dependent hydrolase (beta-lactamase superfamily II)